MMKTRESKLRLSRMNERQPVRASVNRFSTLLLAITWCFLASVSLHAQSYSLDWFTVDGGGGTSTGGVYSVSGTIGQPDAGATMSGGNYSLSGGCWSLFAIQSPGSPLL